MKCFAFWAAVSLFAETVATAAPVPQKGTVKRVRLYPQGVYVTMSVPVSVKGGAEEEIVFPDLWYADPATVELKLMPGTAGVDYVMETQRAASGNDVELQQVNLLRRDTLAVRKARLEADSMVLEREIEFLKANARQEAGSVAQLAAAENWIRDRYVKVYEAQRQNREARTALDKEWADNEQAIRQLNAQASQVTLVRARVNSTKTQKAEFELSYFANAARWQPVYFFRFEPGKSSAELDYRATVKQWTGYDWNRIPATLSYGMPMKTLNRPKLSKKYVSYSKPTLYRSKDAVATKFGGNYTGEAEPQILRLDVSEEMAFDAAVPQTATSVEVSENDVSYRLGRMLTLASSADRQVQQTVPVRKDTIPVFYEYEVTPKSSGDVLLLAYVPQWQRLHLADGRMNIFCDGRMSGQSNVSVRSTQDTLVLPLMFEPLIVADRKEAGDYRERASGSKMERSRSYEIRIKNNKEFPVKLTVKDQYPVSNTDEVEVTLTERSDAQVDAASGMLTWRLELAPGEERLLTFGYTVRYPKGGTIRF